VEVEPGVFEAHWRLESPSVVRAARGEADALPPAEAALLPVVRGTRAPAGSRVLLPFPARFPEVFRDDVAAGVAARRRFGRTATALFADGWEAVSVTERDGAPAYVLDRRPA
jgi:hypothetical protein